MEEGKKEQTALVYCVFIGSGDTIFSKNNDYVHHYAYDSQYPYMVESMLEDILSEIEHVMYCPEKERHVFYLPYLEKIRKALSEKGIQFYSILPKANCKHEWVGRLYLDGCTKAFIDKVADSWVETVCGASEYPNEMIIRLSFDKQLSNIPIKNFFAERETRSKEASEKRKRERIIDDFEFTVMVFVLFLGIYITWKPFADFSISVIILLSAVTAFGFLGIMHLILRLIKRLS